MGKIHDSCPFLFPSSFRSLPSSPSESTLPSSSSSSPPPSPSFCSSRSDSSFNSPYKSTSSLPGLPRCDSSASSHFRPAAFGPCAACKFHNRRCSERCYLASFLPPNDVHNFSVVDSVFGSGNVVDFLQRNGTSSYIPLLVLLRDTGREDGGVHLDSKNITLCETDVHKQLVAVVNSDHVRELIQGRELMKQLKVHLSSESSDMIREGLVQSILSSFENSLSRLNLSGCISQLQNDVSPIVIARNDRMRSQDYVECTGSVNFDIVHCDGAKKRCRVSREETSPRLTTHVRDISENEVRESLDDELNGTKCGQEDGAGTKLPSGFAEEMESLETAAQKTNVIGKEMTLNFSPHVFADDHCLQNVTPSDDFNVDELLDFSYEADGLIQEEEKEAERREKSSIHSVSVNLAQTHFHAKISDRSFDFTAVQLGVTVDDLANLEWLSHFVEDSYSGCFAPFPAGVSLVKPMEENRMELFKSPVPVRARSKRSRRGWSRTTSLGSSSSTSFCAPLKRRKALRSVAFSFIQ